jgi:hypothetical protein
MFCFILMKMFDLFIAQNDVQLALCVKIIRLVGVQFEFEKHGSEGQWGIN